MTKTQITSSTAFLSLLVLLVGANYALASEVTGTLSSDTVSKAAPSGNISGSVTNEPQGNIGGTVTSEPSGSLGGTVTSSGSGGSSSSGGGSQSSGSGGDSTSDAPAGDVLGVSSDNLQTPAFPNAGFAPTQQLTNQTPWSAMVHLLRNLISF